MRQLFVIVCNSAWLVAYLAGWPVGWLIGLRFGWLTWLADYFAGWFVGWPAPTVGVMKKYVGFVSTTAEDRLCWLS